MLRLLTDTATEPEPARQLAMMWAMFVLASTLLLGALLARIHDRHRRATAATKSAGLPAGTGLPAQEPAQDHALHP